MDIRLATIKELQEHGIDKDIIQRISETEYALEIQCNTTEKYRRASKKLRQSVKVLEGKINTAKEILNGSFSSEKFAALGYLFQEGKFYIGKDTK